ncbi:MAG: pyridoxine 5'-phosphate synthase, partial [Terricaulis sp.]
VVELHVGAYCDLVREGRQGDARGALNALRASAAHATRLGLEVHAGHGIDFETIAPVAAIPEIAEFNIGHFLIGEAIFIGLEAAVTRMRRLMDEARA